MPTKYFQFHTNYYKQDEKLTVLVDTLNLSISKIKPIKETDVKRTLNFNEITQTEFEEKQEDVKKKLGVNITEKLVDRRYTKLSTR